MDQKVRNRWVVVFGAVVVQLCLGAVYAWSLFNQPLINTFGWTRESVVLTFSVTLASFAISTIIAGKIQDKIGPRWVATTGGVLLGLGLMLASTAKTPFQLYIYYGLIGGIGIGTAYVCPVATCAKWFPDMRGLITGIAVAGFGAGSLLFKPVILRFIEVFGVMNTFLYLGIIYLLAISLGAQLLTVPPKGYVPAGWTPPPSKSTQDWSPTQMFTTYQFYVLWLMFLVGSIAGLMIISFATDIGINVVKLDKATASTAVIIIALFNAGGRIIWGKLSDWFGRKECFLMIYTLLTGVMLYMSMATMNYWTFLISVSLVGFFYGGLMSIVPSKTADYYGTKHLGINYGIIFQAYGVAAFIGPLLATSFDFAQGFMIAAALTAFGAVIALTLKAPKPLEQGITILEARG